MKTNPEYQNQTSQPTLMASRNWPEMFLFCAGIILILSGVTDLLCLFEKTEFLNYSSPILGVCFYYFFLVTGLIQLGLGGFCFFCRTKLVYYIMSWGALIYLAYIVGLWLNNNHLPYPLFRSTIISTFTNSPSIIDGIAVGVTLLLTAGSVLFLIARQESIDNSTQIKVACPHCSGRIQFPTAYIGVLISCPHCQESITLQ